MGWRDVTKEEAELVNAKDEAEVRVDEYRALMRQWRQRRDKLTHELGTATREHEWYEKQYADAREVWSRLENELETLRDRQRKLDI